MFKRGYLKTMSISTTEAERGADYLSQISEEVVKSHGINSKILEFSTVLGFSNEATNPLASAMADLLLRKKSFNSEDISNHMMSSLDDDGIKAMALANFAAKGLASAQAVADGKRLDIDPLGINGLSAQARLRVLNPGTVRIRRTWRPLSSPYDLEPSRILEEDSIHAGEFIKLSAAPALGGVIELRQVHSFRPYHSIGNLVDPITGEKNVELELITPDVSTSFAVRWENEQFDQA